MLTDCQILREEPLGAPEERAALLGNIADVTDNFSGQACPRVLR